MRHRRAARNNGFTLIELLIAVVIIMVSMLALMTSIEISIRTNMDNEIRNFAIRVTNETAEALLALPINDAELTVGSAHNNTYTQAQQDRGFPNPTQSVRAFQQFYTITWDVTAPSDNLRQININVTYTYRNRSFSNSSLIYKHSAV